MSVDIEKLRALHAATTQGPWEYNGYSAVFSGPMCDAYNKAESEIPADSPDSAYAGLPEPVVAHVPAAAGDTAIGRHAADAAFIAAVHGSVLPLCDRVERAEAEVDLLRAENARLAGELAEIREHHNAASDGFMGRHYALYYAAASDGMRAQSTGARLSALAWMLAVDHNIQRHYALFYDKHPELATPAHNASGCAEAVRALALLAALYLDAMGRIRKEGCAP